jgi:hypothetical protein
MTRTLLLAILLLTGCASDYSRESPGSQPSMRTSLLNRCQSEARQAGQSPRSCPCVVESYIATYGNSRRTPSQSWMKLVKRQCGT